MQEISVIKSIFLLGSVMSDLSYTRDEDEFLNVSGPDTRGHKRQMPSKVHCAKRRRSGNAKTIEVKYFERVRISVLFKILWK